MAALADSALTVELRHALGRISLDVRLGAGRETLALIGPSGSGKTSVLRAVAGLLEPEWGHIEAAGRCFVDTPSRTNLPPEERRVGMVFQDGALFPHMSVGHNVAYGLFPRPSSHRDKVRRVAEILERFEIGKLASAKPTAISGGERQRVALARAVASAPDVLLLDEPLSALDSVTKAQVSRELSHWLADLRLPTILVSHDFGDVVGLADRVAVIEEGHIAQVGTTSELLRSPRSEFVAAFAGINFFSGTAAPQGSLTVVTTAEGVPILSTDKLAGSGGAIVYPWEVTLSESLPEGSALNVLWGPVIQVAEVGNKVRVALGSTPPIVAEITIESASRLGLMPGRPLCATWKAAGTRLVAKNGAGTHAAPADGRPPAAARRRADPLDPFRGTR
jgi:molybdate transport system ATP-binding protein